MDFKKVQPDSEAPVKATREVNFSFPSALLEVMHEPKAKGLDRGEMMRTAKGVENKRCALVQLLSIRQLDQAKTFQILKNNSVHFLTNHTELTAKIGHLNHVELVESLLMETHRAHSDIAAINQPSNLYWLKDAWLEEMGSDAVAVNLASQGSLVGKRRLDATANSQTRYCCLPLIVLINCCVSGTINYSVTRRRLLQLPSKAVAQQVLLMCPRILWLLLLHRFLLRHRHFCRKFSSKLLLLALLAVLTWLRYRARQNGMRTVAEIRAAEETDRAAARAREAVVAENHRSLMQVQFVSLVYSSQSPSESSSAVLYSC